MCLRGVGERGMFRRRNAMAHHEVLREILGAFELCRFLSRPENAMAGGPHGIHNTGRERCFRPDHRQRYFIFLNKIFQLAYANPIRKMVSQQIT
jgi:hypothetical protein